MPSCPSQMLFCIPVHFLQPQVALGLGRPRQEDHTSAWGGRGAACVPISRVSLDNISVSLQVPALIRHGPSDIWGPCDSDSARMPWWLLGQGPLKDSLSGTPFATRKF